MASIPFHLIDVFSTIAYKGNPLSIVEDLDGRLTDTEMKLITRQFNLSETTFLLSPTKPGADYKLRSFLPNGKEVFGAGHNILGVWWFLAQSQKLDFSRQEPTSISNGKAEYVFHQELGGEVIPVKIFREEAGGNSTYSVAVRQVAPKAHAYHPNPQGLGISLGVSPTEIGFNGKEGTLLQPRVMSTSTTHHLLVPVSSVQVLDKIVLQRDKILQELAAVDEKAYGTYFFTPIDSLDGKTQTYKARFFSPGMSGEDPATGSAAGPLSAYLYQHKELDVTESAGKIHVIQGHTVGRQCLIEVRLNVGTENSIDELEVDIVGRGVLVGEGQLRVPRHDITF